MSNWWEYESPKTYKANQQVLFKREADSLVFKDYASRYSELQARQTVSRQSEVNKFREAVGQEYPEMQQKTGGGGGVLGALKKGVGAVLKPIGRAFEWEAENLSAPIARTLLSPLPESKTKDVLQFIGEEVLLRPSNLITMPFIGAKIGQVGLAGARAAGLARAAKVAAKAGPEIPQSVQKLTRLLTVAKSAEKPARAAAGAKASMQAGTIAAAREAAIGGKLTEEAAFKIASAARRGIEAAPDLYNPLAISDETGKLIATGERFTEKTVKGAKAAKNLVFEQADVDDLQRRLLQAQDTLAPHDWLNARTALEKTLLGLKTLPHEREYLARVFGEELGKALNGFTTLSEKAGETLLDLANVPRAVMSSFDLSAPFRQGILFVTRPKEFASAFKSMFQALGSEKTALAINKGIQVDPYIVKYGEAAGKKLYQSPLAGMGKLAEREEFFISKIASSAPGIKLSERTYITFLNKLRADVFKNRIQTWERLGKKFTDEEVGALIHWVNTATGRGSLGKLDMIMPQASALLFSPRLFAARAWNTPTALIAAWEHPLVRKEVARDLVAFVGSGVGLLSLLKVSGAAEVEMDPRSTDFGKIQIGPTRIDPWGGFQQIARTAAQLLSGQRKSGDDLGDMYDANRLATLDRFLEGHA